MKKLIGWTSVLLLTALVVVLGLLFLPKSLPPNYRLTVDKGASMAQVSRTLARDDAVYSRHVLLLAAYATGAQNKLHSGTYRLPKQASAWQIVQRLLGGRPDNITVRIPEGATFAQVRAILRQTEDLRHDTADWSERALLQKLDPAAPYERMEGLLFPDSYDVAVGSSDLAVYQVAYRTLQKRLQAAWDERQDGLPYRNPYELLTMASLVEKETGHKDDRRNVAAVFVNRLGIGMRLQTDPTVIYGMGSAYQGRIRRADLQRDTPYNTYTRDGLTPTPIALPSQAALEAAAHPSNEQYLYFVSRMDGTGLSQFSHTLEEHNAAVRKYILKKGG